MVEAAPASHHTSLWQSRSLKGKKSCISEVRGSSWISILSHVLLQMSYKETVCHWRSCRLYPDTRQHVDPPSSPVGQTAFFLLSPPGSNNLLLFNFKFVQLCLGKFNPLFCHTKIPLCFLFNCKFLSRLLDDFVNIGTVCYEV